MLYKAAPFAEKSHREHKALLILFAVTAWGTSIAKLGLLRALTALINMSSAGHSNSISTSTIPVAKKLKFYKKNQSSVSHFREYLYLYIHV